MDDYRLDDPIREVRRRRWGRPYALISSQIDRMPASKAGWSRELAEDLGLPLTTTIGELLVHADKRERACGKVGYLKEDLLRREGAVPTESTVRIDFAEQYRILGRHIRAALQARGLNGDTLRLVQEAILEAVEKVDQEPDHADDQ